MKKWYGFKEGEIKMKGKGKEKKNGDEKTPEKVDKIEKKAS